MNEKFTLWVGEAAGLVVLIAPFVFQVLPLGWENITLGVLAHGAVQYLSIKYHK